MPADEAPAMGVAAAFQVNPGRPIDTRACGLCRAHPRVVPACVTTQVPLARAASPASAGGRSAPARRSRFAASNVRTIVNLPIGSPTEAVFIPERHRVEERLLIEVELQRQLRPSVVL
jgi:hypothetical protein